MSKSKSRAITRVAVASALISVCSLISIPSPIPITLQTFAVFFSLYHLGGKSGTLSVLVYIAIGAMGLPIFSGFAGGVGRLVDIGGGYIIGFLFSALLYFAFECMPFKKTSLYIIISSALSLLLIYIFGTVQYVIVSGAPIITALLVCVAPFVLPDIVKLLLAYNLSKTLKKRGLNI